MRTRVGKQFVSEHFQSVVGVKRLEELPGYWVCLPVICVFISMLQKCHKFTVCLSVVVCSLFLTSVAGRNLRFFFTIHICVLIAVSHLVFLAFSSLQLFPFHLLLSYLPLAHLVLCNGVVETIATEAYYFVDFF